ncbi:MAG: DUF1559 domain-containing protein [Thermoguttaceae bacterium]|nr:DUF1559 domain-containing protein [Thermoguttaceae bacterium]
MFHAVLPPNSPMCTAFLSVFLLPPTSYHSGGVNAAMADGSVRFISDTIDCGDTTAFRPASGKSPYGVFGAMGTPSGGETISSL